MPAHIPAAMAQTVATVLVTVAHQTNTQLMAVITAVAMEEVAAVIVAAAAVVAVTRCKFSTK